MINSGVCSMYTSLADYWYVIIFHLWITNIEQYYTFGQPSYILIISHIMNPALLG